MLIVSLVKNKTQEYILGIKYIYNVSNVGDSHKKLILFREQFYVFLPCIFLEKRKISISIVEASSEKFFSSILAR